MAAGNFVSEDIDQLRKCSQDILTMLSENGDVDKANKETSYFASETEKARGLEKQFDELQVQIEDKKGQQLEDKERVEKHAVKVTHKLNLMRHILPGVVLDGSQHNHIRGYIKAPTGDVKTFDFDTTRVSSNTITDYLWETV